MAVRQFNGTTDILKCSAGSIGQILNGAWTVVVIHKPVNLNAHKSTMGLAGSGTILLAINTKEDPTLVAVNDFNDNGVNVGVTQDSWNILAVGKASGSAIPRFHGKVLGSGSWVHGDTVSTWAPDTTTCDTAWLGGFADNVFDPPTDGMVACVAIFHTQLSDADIESIQTTPSTQKLADLGAVALWDLNQAAVTTAVEDLIGTADQTSRTGTTVVTGDDPPGWTFGLGGPPQTLRPDADIVTTGWATAPLFSKINESSADGTVITATAS